MQRPDFMEPIKMPERPKLTIRIPLTICIPQVHVCLCFNCTENEGECIYLTEEEEEEEDEFDPWFDYRAFR